MKTPDELQGSKKSHAGLQSGAIYLNIEILKEIWCDSIEKMINSNLGKFWES